MVISMPKRKSIACGTSQRMSFSLWVPRQDTGYPGGRKGRADYVQLEVRRRALLAARGEG
jgi:hypothetical protein